MGKPITAKAAASQEAPGESSSTGSKEKATASTTQNAPATDHKGQADLLAKLIAQVQVQSQELVQVQVQSQELAALKVSF